ncbi:hypothetical protein Tco_0296465 [Tanacetum coccineum]
MDLDDDENNDIRADQSDDTFWWQVTHAFNKATHCINRTKDMIMGKWATLNGNCQKFNANFKRLEGNGKSGDSVVDIFEHAKFQFHEESTTETKKVESRTCVACLEITPWDLSEPVDPVDLTELFGDYVRFRPPGKPRLAKKSNRKRRPEPRVVIRRLYQRIYISFKREAAESVYETRK